MGCLKNALIEYQENNMEELTEGFLKSKGFILERLSFEEMMFLVENTFQLEFWEYTENSFN